MDRNDIPALKAQVKKVVRQADAKGDIDAGRFTLKIAKKEIAKALGIDAEVLNQKQWKQLVKDLVHTAIEDIGPLNSSPVKHPSPKKTDEFILDLLSNEDRAEKRKGKASSSRKRRESEESDASPRPPARKKTKVITQSDEEVSDVKPKKSVKKAEANGKGKKKPVSSAAVISDSDSEGDVKPKKKVKKTDSANGKGKKPISSAAVISDSDEDSDVKPKNTKKTDSSNGKGKKPVSSATIISDSDDDMSDVKPKKVVKKKEPVDTKPKKKAKPTATASSSAPAVEDERVKELKSIVVACGVRKQWKKEFQDMNTPEEQISHLKRLLTSLGMKGQPTKAKAKVIKEKRELAAELGDVLEFEAKRGLGITRGSRSNDNGNGHAEADDAESPIKPRKARTSAARNNVPSMTYVGSDESSQSDSEDGECQGQQGTGSGSQLGSDSGSDSEVDEAKAGNGKQARRKMVPSSEDSNTE